MADENNQIVMKKISDLDESTSLSTGSYTVVSKNGSSYKFDLSKIKADVDLTDVNTKLNAHTQQLVEHETRLDELEDKVNTGGTGGVSEEYVNGELDKKVDKVNGKGLSSNDFTNEHKIKLESLDLSTKADKDHDHDTKYAEIGHNHNGVYLTTQDISNLATKDELSAKIDKVDGKGLSTNDFTNEEKEKLASLDDTKYVSKTDFGTLQQEIVDARKGKENSTAYGSLDKRLDAMDAAIEAASGVDMTAYADKEFVKDEDKKITDQIGDLNTLITDEQDTLVGAINELKTNIPTVPTKTSELTNDSGYVTETVLSGKGYLTEHQSLDDYAKKSDIPTNHVTQNELAEVSGKVVTLETSNTTLSGNITTLTGEVTTLKTTVQGIGTTYATKEELTNGLGTKVNSSDLKTVATTGSYNDLVDKPTPFSGNYNDLTNKPALFDGNYNSLTNTPTIPTTVAELTDKGDYALKTDIPTVPTKTSELTNDSNFLTTIPSEYITETEVEPIKTLLGDTALTTTAQTVTGGVNELKDIISKKIYQSSNVSDMKAMDLEVGDNVITLGYYNINDGGSAAYTIVDDSTLVENGISIHTLNNGLKAKIILNSSLNVLQAGVKNTGLLADDVAQKLQQCIDLYDNIFIPNGSYYVGTTINIPSEKTIIGENVAKTIIKGGMTSGFIFQSVDKSYDITIENMTMYADNNKLCSGIYLQASSNTGLQHFDVTHRLLNINMNWLDTGVKTDPYVRGTWINNVKIYKSKTGFNLLGTDNFINDCVSGEIENEGYIIGANNMISNSKAFCCGSANGASAMKLVGGYNGLSGIHLQQNYGSGIEVNTVSNYIDGVIDSSGYNNLFTAYNVIVNELKNHINIVAIDGRFNSCLDAHLKITTKAHFNNISITAHSMRTNANGKDKMIESYATATNNDIYINGEVYDTIVDDAWKTFNITDCTIQEKHDSSGSYLLDEKNLTITMENYDSIGQSWGSTVRAKLTNTYDDSKNYVIVKAKVKVVSDADNSAYFRMGVVGNASIIQGAIPTYSGNMTGDATKDYIMVVDLNAFRNSAPGIVPTIWLCLFKNTADTSTSRPLATAYVTDLQYKII